LERAEQGGYLLYLKLPQLPPGTSGAGEIEIRSGLGVRSYTATQLERPRLAPVVAQMPLVEVLAVGDLAAVGAVIRAQLERFRSSGNYFRASEIGGKLLAPNEPLEWGERYRLLTQQPLGPVPKGLELEVEFEAERRGWYACEIALPTMSEMESETGREALARYLGRIVKAPRARMYFIEPPPHHIEPDGTHVFPETTKRIVLRRTGHGHISVEGSPKSIAYAIVRDLADQWVEISDMGAGDFTVLLDGGEELLGRIEDCDLFQPRGVRVALEDHTWEIFEPGLRKVIWQGFVEGLQIECPSMRVASHLSFVQEVWVREDTCLILRGTPRGPVNGENFGTLILPVKDGGGIEPQAAGAETRARRAWLEGLIARLEGPNALMCLREQWDKASPAEYGESAVREFAWLRSHIRVARSC